MGTPAPARDVGARVLPVAREALVMVQRLIWTMTWVLFQMLREMFALLRELLQPEGQLRRTALGRGGGSKPWLKAHGEDKEEAAEEEAEREEEKEEEVSAAKEEKAPEPSEEAQGLRRRKAKAEEAPASEPSSPEAKTDSAEPPAAAAPKDAATETKAKAEAKAKVEVVAKAPAAEEKAEDGRDPVLQRLSLPPGCPTSSSDVASAISKVRSEHAGLRFSQQAERERARVTVLGPGGLVRRACEDLQELALLEPADSPESFFALHFVMREAWDLPQDDELLDASLSSEWIDLGAEGGEAAPSAPCRKHGEEGAETGEASPRSVLRSRLREAVPDGGELHLFMDENPFASWGGGAVRVDLIGPLQPETWEAATRIVLSCEALGVYLSRRYDAAFVSPAALKAQLRDQLDSAMSHWKGEPMAFGSGGFGVAASGFEGFEDLAANVGAVLRGAKPPGWHRLEWTPHGAGAVATRTY